MDTLTCTYWILLVKPLLKKQKNKKTPLFFNNQHLSLPGFTQLAQEINFYCFDTLSSEFLQTFFTCFVLPEKKMLLYSNLCMFKYFVSKLIWMSW